MPVAAIAASEAVPSGEKLVSLFETHADIIVKGGREVHYGHKLNLTTGKSGLILDVVVETGQPGRALPSHARAPHRAPGCATATNGQRWRLRQPRQSEAGKGPGRRGCADADFRRGGNACDRAQM